MRHSRLLLAFYLAGCGRVALPPLATPDADVRMEMEARKVESDRPVKVRLQLTHAEGVTLDVGHPTAEGLQTRAGSDHTDRVGDHEVTTREYELTGPAGSYVIALPEVVARHPDGREEKIEVSPLFVDVGATGPSSQLADITVPAPPIPARWPWYVGGGVALVLAVGGTLLWLRWRRQKQILLIPPDPPDVAAMREWDTVFGSSALDDHSRALRLSEVFRRYLEARFGWKATALTTREICDALYQDGIPASLLDRARRVLTPMDLLKYARQGGGAAMFRQLDDDFRAVVSVTRLAQVPPGERRDA